MKESDIYQAIIDAAIQEGWVARRGASGARLYKGAKRKSQDTGRPDIEIWTGPHARYWGLEVKTPLGKLRPAQVEWKGLIEGLGGSVFIVHDMDEVYKAFQLMKHAEGLCV